MPEKKLKRFLSLLFLCSLVAGLHQQAEAAISKTSKRILRPRSGVSAVASDFTAAALSTTSIKWSWSTGTFTDPAITEYRLYSSSTSNFQPLIPGTSFYIDPGLGVNKAYTRWLTVYQGATPGSDSQHIEKYTYALPPDKIAISSMTPISPPDDVILPPWAIYTATASATAIYVQIPPENWFPNPVHATAYVVECSTNAGADYVRNRAFFVPWQTVPLLSNKHYMIRIGAINGDNEITPGIYSATRTFTTPPLTVSSFTAVALSSYTIQWRWPIEIFEGTGITNFRIYRSTTTADDVIPTDNFTGEIVQQLGPGASYWTEVFVDSPTTPSANSRRTRWIKALGFLESQEKPIFQKYIYAVAPATCSLVYLDPPPYNVPHVAENSVTLNWYVWPSTAEPRVGIATKFVIDHSTVAGFAIAVTSAIVGGPPQGAAGLISNTKYDFRIGVINGDLEQTPNDGLNPFAYSKAYKAMTRPAPPSNFLVSTFTDTALNGTWSTTTYANPRYIDGYSIGKKRDIVIGGVTYVYWNPLDFLPGISSHEYSLDYLLTNSTHTLTVWASQTDPVWVSTNPYYNPLEYDGGDQELCFYHYCHWGSLGLDNVGATFATPPNDVSFDTVAAHSIGTWWKEPEVSATQYRVERSTTLGEKGPWVFVSSVTGNHFNDTGINVSTSGLVPSTTYSYRIGAINLLGMQTLGLADATTGYRRDYSFIRSTMTVQISPTLYAVATGTASINWSWTNDVPGVQSYNIYTSTDGIITTILNPGDTYWLEVNLSSSNTRYTRRMRSVTSLGESDFSDASAVTFAANPSALIVTDAGLHWLSIEWSGNGGSRYKIDRSLDMNTWTEVKAWSDVYISTSFTDTGLRLATTHYYAVGGYNQDAIPSVGSATYSGGSSRTLDMPAGVIPIFSTSAVAQSTTGVLSGFGQITVQLPAGAAPSDGYILVNTAAGTNPVGTSSANIAAATANLLPSKLVTGSIAELYFYNLYGSAFTGNLTLPARITMTYTDANSDDILDGDSPQIRAETLKLLNLDTTNLIWNPQSASRLDKAAKTVYADINHFSFYALGSVIPLRGSLADVYAYPNPYKPGSGGDYDQSVFGEGVVFEGLTAGAKIRIFNIAGALVAELSDDDGDGRALWNARSKSGTRAASGLYFYLATNPGNSGDKKTGKITIIR